MEKLWEKLPAKENRVVRIICAAFSMFFIGFGLNLQIHAGIGLSPWNALSMGISYHLPITYGVANIFVSFIVIAVDLCVHENIGFGTLLDALLVGTAMDFWNAAITVSTPDSLILQIVMLLAGLAVVCFGQYLYMATALCCGPRDSMLVGIGKKFPKISIGFINIIIFAVVLVIGFCLGAPIGLGTLISVLANGMIMDCIFKIVNFDARAVVHENIAETIRVFMRKKAEAK